MGNTISGLFGRRRCRQDRRRRGGAPVAASAGQQRMPSLPTRAGSSLIPPTTSIGHGREISKKRVPTRKFSYIPDNFHSVEQVTRALRESGLESSNLIVGIDFTKSNEWTGKYSFGNRSLHALGSTPNPYELAISIIGKTLAPFDEDNLIPCFGFGDATTHDKGVFSFHSDHSPCRGFEEVLSCYKKILPHLQLSGPTSFAPIIEVAMDIVEETHGQYHVLVIIADGQVSKSVDTREGELSPQEQSTINAIVAASVYPLSIVLVGVGDGPWEDMKKFDDKLPARQFDNFQFVNFTSIVSADSGSSGREAAFALAALMEVPIQYRATLEYGILGRAPGLPRRISPRPPPAPAPAARQQTLARTASVRPPLPRSNGEEQVRVCPICLANPKDMAFGCGHTCCGDCGRSLSRCPMCRAAITSRLRLYNG